MPDSEFLIKRYPLYWATLADKGYQVILGFLRVDIPIRWMPDCLFSLVDESFNSHIASDRILVVNYVFLFTSLKNSVFCEIGPRGITVRQFLEDRSRFPEFSNQNTYFAHRKRTKLNTTARWYDSYRHANSGMPLKYTRILQALMKRLS